MNTKLQADFSSALAAAGKSAKKVLRQTPIYRRPERSEVQAMKDAANALAALWKMNSPSLKS